MLRIRSQKISLKKLKHLRTRKIEPFCLFNDTGSQRQKTKGTYSEKNEKVFVRLYTPFIEQ